MSLGELFIGIFTLWACGFMLLSMIALPAICGLYCWALFRYWRDNR